MDETRFDRIEIKGTLAAAGARALGRTLRARLDVDPHGDPDGRYPIVSLYYDTPSFDVYWDRVRGVASRRKLRVRLYGGPDAPVPPICFVEVKQKYYGRVAKRRLVLEPEQALALCGGGPLPQGLGSAERAVAREVQDLVAAEGLRPACLVRYVRQAFLGRDDAPDLRVTLDTRLRCGAADLDPRRAGDGMGIALLDEGLALLEIKVDHAVPLWLVGAARSAGMSSRAVSKYALACEALHLVHNPAAPALPLPGRRAAPRTVAVSAGATLD